MEPKPNLPEHLRHSNSAVHKAWAGRVALQALVSTDSVSESSVAYEMYVLD